MELRGFIGNKPLIGLKRLLLLNRDMPIGNLTGMTDAERGQLLDWIRHGAPH